MDVLAILEVAIGIVTVYLILSLVCTSLTETFIGKSIRRQVLRQSITNLVGEDLTKQLYESPEVEALRAVPKLKPPPAGESAEEKEAREAKEEKKRQQGDPSYIPTDVFARGVLDLITEGEWRRSGGLPSVLRDKLVEVSGTGDDGSKASADKAKVGRKLVALLDEASGDLDVFKNKIELWFDRTGDRSKGWFKRRLNRRLILLGFLVAASVNADTIMIFQRLSDDSTLREAAVEIATEQLQARAPDAEPQATDADEASSGEEGTPGESEAEENSQTVYEEIREDVGAIAPLVGWSGEDPLIKAFAGSDWGNVAWLAPAKLIGLLLTAFAISLGAPFWFNLLQRLVNIRGSVQAGKAKDLQQGDGKAEEGDDAGDGSGASQGGSDTPAYTGPMAGFAPSAATVNLGNAYWLAKAADLAYETDMDKVKATVASWGMMAHIFEATDKSLWRGHEVPQVDTQGFVAVDDNAVIVSFRGTEPTKPADVITDLKFKPEGAQEYGSGEIHRGFKAAIEAVWPEIQRIVETHATNKQTVWFAGHSLGGALAVLGASCYDQFVKDENLQAKQTIAEAEQKLEVADDETEIAVLTKQRQDALDGLRGRVAGVYTIGQPRVGDEDFANELDDRLGDTHVRIINNRDVVPRVPIRAMGFRHSGTVLYLDEFGRLHRDPGLWYRLLDTVAVSRDEIKKAAEGVKDHSSGAYVDLLDKARKSDSALTRLALA